MNQSKKYASESDEQHRRRIKNRYDLAITPTFPLDAREVDGVRNELVLQTPRFMLWQLLAQLGSRFSLLSRFSESWAKIEPELSEAVVEHVIKQSNVAQNQVLKCVIDTLEAQHFGIYARTMRDFLWLKQSIEGSLKNNRVLTTQRADIETLVDSIVQEVCYEVLTVTDLQAKLANSVTKTGAIAVDELRERIDICHERISKAHDALKETELQTRVPEQSPFEQTHAARDDFDSKVLDKLIDTLREENDLAKKVSERVQEELTGA